MLTHRKNHDNMLLVITGVMIALSGIAYVFLLSGFAVVETFLLALTIALSLFFIKFALTIALVVLSLNTVRSDSQETLRNNRQKYPPSAIDRIS
jgi:Zn-dependent protease with chaperone function